jgi:hypothetical protein
MPETMTSDLRRQSAQIGFLLQLVNADLSRIGSIGTRHATWNVTKRHADGSVTIRLRDRADQPLVIDCAESDSFKVRATGERSELGFVSRRDFEAWTLPRLPSSDVLELVPDMANLWKQRKALHHWQATRHPDHRGILRAFESERFAQWPVFDPVARVDWLVLTDDRYPGVATQRSFVRKALATPDFAFLNGPPGSGKTTVICELVAQLVARHQRVLVASQQHAAIDNVLDRLMAKDSPVRRVVLPMRLGWANKTSGAGTEWHESNLAAALRNSVLPSLRRTPERTVGQEWMLQALSVDETSIERLLVEMANVVAGTVQGVTGTPTLRADFDSAQPVFDVLIVDEAGLTTLADFLVPALVARRWIVVGDPMQLSPHLGTEEVLQFLRRFFERSSVPHRAEEDDAGRSAVRDLALELGNAFDVRLDPALSERHTARAERIIDEMGLRPDETVALRRQLAEFEILNRRSVIEQLATCRPPSNLLEAHHVNAVDVGMPPDALARRLELLETQARMHPDISALVRDRVYGGRAMIDDPAMAERRAWTYSRYERRVEWINVRADARLPNGARDDFPQIEAEVTAVLRELDQFLAWVEAEAPGTGRWSVILLTPYDAQRRVMLNTFAKHFEVERARDGVLRVGRVDVDYRIASIQEIQGREADLVFLSIGKRRLTAFTRSTNRMNVALTRARYQLVVVGDHRMAQADEQSLIGTVARSLTPRTEINGRD